MPNMNSPEKPVRLRRSQLSVPGSSDKMIAKAAALDCDGVILDLEDAVAPSEKPRARSRVVAALTELAWQPRSISVRINDVTTPDCHEDIIKLVTGAGEQLDTLILTKTRGPMDVQFVHLLLDQLEARLGLQRRIGIECVIEDVTGIMHVETIAGASNRLESLVFGMGDYAASQGMQLDTIGAGSEDYPPDLWHYPRYKLTIACRANGLDAVDGPYANFRDAETLVIESRRARVLGMTGKWSIHPDQLAIIEPVFSPAPAAVARARAQKAAYDQALAEGQGAISVDGVMVDAASVRLAQALIDQANLLGL